MTQLSIKNYALIDELDVSFERGFTTITGETGAGKSILLGALSLVLGKRADLSSLKDKSKKCSIEAEFNIGAYQLEPYFEVHDLDYDVHSILRRDILPSGKSRAFINDTPVTLDILAGLGTQLVDIHSQHQTLQLTENEFQFKVIDGLARNGELLMEYTQNLNAFHELNRELNELVEHKSQAVKELDYNSFLLEELKKAPLQRGVLEELESEYGQLNNIEVLMELLSSAHQLLNEEQLGVLSSISELKSLTQKLHTFGNKYGLLNERIQSVAIELTDLAGEVEQLSEGIEPNPNRLQEVNDQLQLLHDLFKKHQVASVEELMVIQDDLSNKVLVSLNIDESIAEKQREVTVKEEQLKDLCSQISNNRKQVLPKLLQQLEKEVISLGMPSATFKIEISPADGFKKNGMDELTFLFSANKGSEYGELKKVASGGELSRIMLAIKSILAYYEKLPTLMFDEIDTGVSGEISNRMGEIMKTMGETMQVFSITHLPQVASKGRHQFKVYKQEEGNSTFTKMKELSDKERVNELAEMLGGKSFSESAKSHAKQMLLHSGQ